MLWNSLKVFDSHLYALAVFSIERERLEIKFIVIVSPLLSSIIQNKMKQNKIPTKYRTQPFLCSSILNFGLGAEASRGSVNGFFSIALLSLRQGYFLRGQRSPGPTTSVWFHLSQLSRISTSPCQESRKTLVMPFPQLQLPKE